MRQQSINISQRAYAALVASASRIVLAQDAQPILASDIEPLLHGGFRRHEIERALARKLKGKLAADTASPADVASKLLDMLDGGEKPEKDTPMNTNDRSPPRRSGARDGLSAELQKVLRSKLDAREFEAVMAALGGGNNSEDEPDESSEYSRQQFGASPPRDPDDDEDGGSSGMEDMGGNATVAKPGDFDDDDTADDDPPAFPGKPLVGGKQMPLSIKQPRSSSTDCRSQAMDQSFAKRFPEVARLGLGEPQRQYRDGTPTHDPRLLSGSTPTPRRHAAMDSASSLRSAKSFAERHPDAARIKVI